MIGVLESEIITIAYYFNFMIGMVIGCCVTLVGLSLGALWMAIIIRLKEKERERK